MRSMTFLVNDRSTGGRIPAVAVTITENSDGSLSFELKVIGPYTGDLRGFFFDIADESHIGKLSVAPTSAGFTEFRQGNDSIKDLGNGANMQGLLGSGGGYDAGIEIGSAGIGKDDYQSFSFTLTSSAGHLTLEDFSNVDFGLRLTSVGFDRWGGRDGGVKLLEHTSSAIDAIDDANSVDEDESPNSVGGNVFANDLNLDCAHLVTAVNGSVWNVGHEVEGTYGTLRLKLDGSYTYTLDNTKPAVQALALGQEVTETFSYTAKSFDEWTSFSTDSAFLRITITGANDAPEIAGDTTGEVFEDGSRSASGQLDGLDPDANSQLTWSVVGSGPMTPVADYRFLLDNLNIVRDGVPFFNDDFGSGGPPPAAPAFNYFTFGTFLESGGRAIMDGGLGTPFTIPGAGTVIAQTATLNTDIDDMGPDAGQGLRRTQDFRVEARFDLVMPEEERLNNYVVRLSDGANDIVEVGVRRMEDGSVAVVLREVDTAGTVPVILEAIPLAPAPGDQQIVLRLQHAANTDLVTASFDLLNGGVVTQSHAFTQTGDIFSNETWTRVQVTGQSLATPQNGVYGTLSVEADGEWHYALNNAAANVQALAQGEHVDDVFTITVTDEHGAADTETVTIDVSGSNDAPIITGGTNFGFVAEDTPTQTASGQLFATDVDHGAVLRWSAGPSSSLPLPGVPNAFQFFGYSSDYDFTIDQFTIERNGVVIFDDPFSDGMAPPSAPAFANGVPASYQAIGGYTESGDRAQLNGEFAAALRGVANPNLLASQAALLLTNIDPADLTRGLKSDDDFTVEARFDLAAPGAGQAYGITLNDNTFGGLPADQLGDSNVSLLVRPGPGGGLIVQFNDFDSVTDSATVLETLAFAPELDENQIVLRLAHDADEPGLVHAEFDLLGGVGGPRTFELTGTGHIFGSGTPGYAGDDENWIRPQFVAFGPDTHAASTTFQGTYGSLTVDQTGTWTYTLDNGSPLVQALPGPLPPQPGQPPQILPQDVISVRVVDEHGLSSFRPVFITVAGTNDAPVATDDGIDELDFNGTLDLSNYQGYAFEGFTHEASGGGFDDDTRIATGGGVMRSVDGGNFFLETFRASATAPATRMEFWGYDDDVLLGAFSLPGLMPGEYALVNFGALVPSVDEVHFLVFPPEGQTASLLLDDVRASRAAALSEDETLLINVLANDFDIDAGDSISVTGFFPGGYGAQITLNPDGTFLYDPTQSPQLQALGEGETVVDGFTYTITDRSGATDTGFVSVRVAGANEAGNTAPLAVPDTNAGDPVVEQGFAPGAPPSDSFASGNVLANDFDPDSNPGLHVTALNGMPLFGMGFATGTYGSLQLNADGGWSYTLHDFDEDTNALAQGEPAFDQFTYTVADAQAASSSTTLTVAISGTNDFPMMLPGGNTGEVFEDGLSMTGGQLSAFDPDHGATLDFALSFVPGIVQPADYEFRIDHFTVTRQRPDDLSPIQVLNDDFGDGAPPPSGLFIDGTPAYGSPTGGTFLESGGRAVMDGELASTTFRLGMPEIVSGHGALVLMSTSSDVTRGLRATHTYEIAGRFDLIVPDDAGQAYGISLTDQRPGFPGDDHIQLLVRHDEDGVVRVVLREGDAAANSTTLIDSALLGPVADGDQIVLRLNHTPARPGTIVGSFEMLRDGVVVQSEVFDQAGQVYGTETPFSSADDEDFTRPTFLAISPTHSSILKGIYGTLVLDDDGQWQYTLDNADPDTQALAQGAIAVDSFNALAIDQFATASLQAIQVTVHGADDTPVGNPPVITGGTTTGQVYEDGAAGVARGQLTASDPDPGAVLAWRLDTTPDTMPTFGSVSVVEHTGEWTYFLNHSAVQQLGQGASIQDDFVVRVIDDSGASDTQVVTINVTGTNDRPNLPPTPLQLFVSEDSLAVSGETSAFDVDAGSLLHWSLNRGSALGYFSDYEFLADSFSVNRDGVQIFHDPFDGGGAPPSAPNFSNNTVANYTTTGLFAEIDGKLVMRGDNAFAFRGTGNDALVVGNEAILATNVDPANMVNGLKQNHQFVVDGVFDLITPQLARQGYGLTLTDAVNRIADDLLSLTVARDPVDDQIYVRFANSSAVLDTATLVDRDLLVAGGADQIRLVLSHAADSGDVSASYELLDDGVIIGGGGLGQAGIFGTDTPFAGDDENWIRAGLFSNGVDPGEFVQTLAGAYGTLTVDSDVINVGQLVYTPGPGAQALRQGDVVIDTFFVRAVDQFGMSTPQRVDVTVNGLNDPPLATPDSNSVMEDVITQAVGNVLANDSDVDNGSVLTVATPGTFFGAYGTLTLNTNGSYVYQLDHDLADSLADGQVVHDIFEAVYGVTDGVITRFSTLLDIEITGTGEAPVPIAGEVFEDGPRKASGEIDLTGAANWSVLGAGPMAPWAEYRFRIDNLTITRDGGQFFNDGFDSGGPPPQAPGFAPGTGYLTSGSFTETGGRANMDGTLAAAAATGFAGHFALLNTDTTADPTQGLKQNHAFRVEARFDLVLPAEELQTYGIRLTDAGAGTGDDIVEVAVRRLADDSVAVILRESDLAGAVPSTLQEILLTPAPSDNRIILRLDHAAGSDEVRASFSLVNGDVVATPTDFTSVGHIFGNETWTRAQFLGFSPSQPQNGLYGTLELEADGQWTYSLRNNHPGVPTVQNLAQGERATDAFAINVTDALGGISTETIAIDVVGTNDNPSPVISFNTFFSGPSPFTGTYVVEGSAPQTASGSVFGNQDVDHGPPVQWSVTANPTPPPPGQVAPAYRSDYLFKLDELKITRDDPATTEDDAAPPLLLDTFDTTAPPAPQGNYALTLGNFTTDGQHAVMNGQVAGAIGGVGTSDLLAAHVAVADTNISASSPGRGLKSHDDFTAEARFELDFLPGPGQSFGVALSDRAVGELPPDQLGDDILFLTVTRDAGGDLIVQFDERDAVADSITVLGTLSLDDQTPAPGSEIVLRLVHDTGDLGRVQASFDVLEGGVSVQHGVFAEDLDRADRIFGAETPLNPYDDEVWTRVQIVASGHDTAGQTAQGRFGTLSISDNGNWIYTLDNADLDTQNLGHGVIGMDSFNWRATDAYGASVSRTFNINVIGTGDAPAANTVGGPGNDMLLGSPNADHLTGGPGADLLIGLGGSDVFDYNSLGEGLDTITDFTPGAGGDIMDLHDLLQGYVPGVSNPANFVQLQQFQALSGPGTTVAVNADGLDFDFVPMATLQGVGGLSFEDFSAHNLLL